MDPNASIIMLAALIFYTIGVQAETYPGATEVVAFCFLCTRLNLRYRGDRDDVRDGRRNDVRCSWDNGCFGDRSRCSSMRCGL